MDGGEGLAPQPRSAAGPHRLDHAGLPQPPALAGGVAELGEDLLVVLAEQRRVMTELLQLFKMTGGASPLDEELLGGVKDRAERKVKAAILLGAVAREQELTVTPAEVDARLAEIAEKSGKHIAKVRVEYQGERAGVLESQILEEKLMDYLMGQATILDAPPDQAVDAEAEAAPKEKAAAKKKPAKKSGAKKATKGKGKGKSE